MPVPMLGNFDTHPTFLPITGQTWNMTLHESVGPLSRDVHPLHQDHGTLESTFYFSSYQFLPTVKVVIGAAFLFIPTLATGFGGCLCYELDDCFISLSADFVLPKEK